MSGHLLRRDVAREYSDYLRDESRKKGSADTISFPADDAEIRRLLATVGGGGVAVTTQGGRTGITGGAVPNGGHILNLSHMKRVRGLRHDAERDLFFIAVEPGLALSELRAALHAREFDTTGWSSRSLAALKEFQAGPAFFFPPDPTETSASIGGMVACNASGACTFHYGPTRPYVESLRVVLGDGDMLALQRGTHRVTNGAFEAATTDGGRTLRGTVPTYAMPGVKNAAGFYARRDMDLIDLFVGSEGTLGVFSEIELRLIPMPACRWGVTLFFPAEAAAVAFVKAVRAVAPGLRPVAVEFFDAHALNLLRRQKASNPAFSQIPDLPAGFHTAIYVEYHGEEDAVMQGVETMTALVADAGGSEDATWVADTDAEVERLKFFRHSVPESVNLLIDERRKSEPCLTKLGTDMAVPDGELDAVLELYHAGLARTGLEHVMFGHIGNNHLHVNIIPRSLTEYDIGKDLYLEWARRVVAMGGTVSAEHGIGKFKVALLREMYGEQGVHEMRAVKKVFDPEGKLNPGNLF